MLSDLYLGKPVSKQHSTSHTFCHSPGRVVVRSSPADALGQVVDDHTGGGIGSEGDRGAVEQACTAAAGADGEGLALLVLGESALRVTLLDRSDASESSECRRFDLSRDGAADALDGALRRLAFEDWRGGC